MATDEEVWAGKFENALDFLADALSNIRDLAAPEDAERELDVALNWHIDDITSLIRDEDAQTEAGFADMAGRHLELRLRLKNSDAPIENIRAVVRRVIEEVATRSAILDRTV